MSQQIFLADRFGPTETIGELQVAVRTSLSTNCRLLYSRIGCSLPPASALRSHRAALETLIGVRSREALRARGEQPERYTNTSGFFLDVSLTQAEAAYAESAARIDALVSRGRQLLTSALYTAPATSVQARTPALYAHDFGYGPYPYEPGSSVTAGGTSYLPAPSREVAGVVVSVGVSLTGMIEVETELGVEAFTFSTPSSVDAIAAGMQSERFSARVSQRVLTLTPADDVRCLRVRQTQLAKTLGLAKSTLQTARGFMSADHVAAALGGRVERQTLYSGRITLSGSRLVSPSNLPRALLRTESGDVFIVDGGHVYDFANILQISQISPERCVLYSERVRTNLSAPATQSTLPVGVTSRSSTVSVGVAVEVGDTIGAARVVGVTRGGDVQLSAEVDEGQLSYSAVGQSELLAHMSDLEAMLAAEALSAVDAALRSRGRYDSATRVAQYASVWRRIEAQHLERGYDRAADLLTALRIDDYLSCTATTATYSTSLDDAVQEVSRAIYQA